MKRGEKTLSDVDILRNETKLGGLVSTQKTRYNFDVRAPTSSIDMSIRGGRTVVIRTKYGCVDLGECMFLGSIAGSDYYRYGGYIHEGFLILCQYCCFCYSSRILYRVWTALPFRYFVV